MSFANACELDETSNEFSMNWSASETALQVDPVIARLISLERTVSCLISLHQKTEENHNTLLQSVNAMTRRLNDLEVINQALREDTSRCRNVCAAQSQFLSTHWNLHPEWDVGEAHAQSQRFVRSHFSRHS